MSWQKKLLKRVGQMSASEVTVEEIIEGSLKVTEKLKKDRLWGKAEELKLLKPVKPQYIYVESSLEPPLQVLVCILVVEIILQFCMHVRLLRKRNEIIKE